MPNKYEQKFPPVCRLTAHLLYCALIALFGSRRQSMCVRNSLEFMTCEAIFRICGVGVTMDHKYPLSPIQLHPEIGLISPRLS